METVNAEPLDIVYRPLSTSGAASDGCRPSSTASIRRRARASIQTAICSRISTVISIVCRWGRHHFPLQPQRLAAGFAAAMGHRLSVFTLKEGLKVFTELGLLRATLREDAYELCMPKQKLDLMVPSPSYRQYRNR